MSYTSVFGGTTIYPSDPSYLPIALDADIALEWPLESNSPTYPAARFIDVTTSGAYEIALPDATQASPGETILFNNLSGSTNTFNLVDDAGGAVATVGIGEQWQVVLTDVATAAGVWRVFRYGASTASVQASALAGYGITVQSNQLSQSVPVTTFSSSPRTLLTTDRASMLVWTGTGACTVNLLAAATAGNNYFISFHNDGGGDMTLDANGSETIDGATTLALRPGDSASLTTDSLEWFTLGLGQQAVFAFDYTSIDLTGAGATYTLAGAELNRIAYKFIGVLSNDVEVIVPPTVQQYWIDNSTTGSFQLDINTASGTPVTVSQGSRGIYYCDGADVVNAATAGVSLPINASDGGTGITSYAIGDIIYASGATTLAKLSDVATGNALISGGVTTAPAWGKIGLTTHISGILAVANGGTGLATLTSGYILTGNDTGVVTLLAPPAGSLVGTSATQTLTNKRVTPRVSSTASIASPLAWNSDNFDAYAATAQSGAFTISADAGTPTDFQKAMFRIEDNGTTRTITFTGGSSKSFQPCTAGFTVSGSNWTIATTANKALYIFCSYNSNTSRWDILAVAEEV